MQYCEEKRVEKKIKAPCRLVLPWIKLVGGYFPAHMSN
jgi:hypothetical protein